MIDLTLGGAPVGDPLEFFDQRYVMETNSPRHPDKRPRFVHDPAGSGRLVMVCHLESTDPPNGIAQRTEIAVRKEYAPPGKERWYALSFYIDQHWPIYDKKTKFVLAQIHTSQRTTVLSPPLEISVRGDRLTLTVRHNTRPVPPTSDVVGDYNYLYATKSNSSQLFVPLGKLNRQQWYCFVINAGWSWETCKGYLKVWMNGAMVHEQYQAPNCYQNLVDGLGQYPKIGIYAPGGFHPEYWTGKVAWVKNYVDWVVLADPERIGPGEMFSRTPYRGGVEATWPKG